MNILKLASLVLVSIVISVLLVSAPNGDNYVARDVLGAMVFDASAIRRVPSDRHSWPQASTPRFEAADCPFRVAEGERIECGYLIVLEDRNQPNSRTIKLAVAILKSRNPSPAPDPVIFLAGGPGDRALDQVRVWRNSSLRRTRDFILIDQRGTGYSQPSLQCQEWIDRINNNRGRILRPEEDLALRLQSATQCRDRLIREGVNLAAYNSAASAADLKDLRLVLGYPEWNLYGRSYGTRVALTAMRDHPEGIRSVILDSAVPLQAKLYEESSPNAARAFGVLFDGCAADPACHTAFPDLERVFGELVNRLDANPRMVAIPDPQTGIPRNQQVTGEDLVEGLFESLHDVNLIPFLPLAGYQINAGNEDVLTAMASQIAEDPHRFSRGLRWSVQCYEEAPFNNLDQLKANLKRYTRLRVPKSRTDVSELEICKIWGVPPAGPIENEPVKSDIPTLVVAGEYDPVTPPAWGKLAASTLSQSFHFEFPGLTHGVSTGGECQTSIRDSFVNNPTVAPDASCIARMKGPPFVTDVYVNGGVYKLATDLLRRPDLLQVSLVAFCVLLFLSTLIGWPFAYWLSRVKCATPAFAEGTRVRNPHSALQRRARWLAGVVAALNLIFGIGLVWFIQDAVSKNQNILLFGLSSAARPLFVLPLLAALLTVGVLILAVLAWKKRYWSAAGRVHYSLVALAAVGFISFLNYWGLLRL